MRGEERRGGAGSKMNALKIYTRQDRIGLDRLRPHLFSSLFSDGKERKKGVCHCARGRNRTDGSGSRIPPSFLLCPDPDAPQYSLTLYSTLLL